MSATNIKDLPAFYRHQTWHAVLFGWVKCYKMLYPSTTTREVAGAFLKEFDFDTDENSVMVAITTYDRTNKDHLQSLKS